MQQRPIVLSGVEARAALLGTLTTIIRPVTQSKYLAPNPTPMSDGPVMARITAENPRAKGPGMLQRNPPFMLETPNQALEPFRVPKTLEGLTRQKLQAHFLSGADGLQYQADLELFGNLPSTAALGGWQSACHMPLAAIRLEITATKASLKMRRALHLTEVRGTGCTGGHGSIPGYYYAASEFEHFDYEWRKARRPAALDTWVWVLDVRAKLQVKSS